MKLHFITTKTHRAGSALAIAIALGVAGCGSARHISQTSTEAATPVHAHQAKPSAEHRRGRRQAVRPHGTARSVSYRAARAKPEHKTDTSAHRHINRSAPPKTSAPQPTTVAHQHAAGPHQRAAATKRRASTRSSRPDGTKTRSSRAKMTPDGGGTAPSTPLNADGAATGGGQSGTSGSAAQGVSADG